MIKEEKVPILGLPSCCELGLLHVTQKQVNELFVYSSSPSFPSAFQENKGVFFGIAKLPIEYEIKLKDNYVPVVRPPRRITFKNRDSVKKKFDDTE